MRNDIFTSNNSCNRSSLEASLMELVEDSLLVEHLKTLKAEDADQLVDRINESMNHGLTLSNEDLQLIVQMIQSLIYLQSKAENNELTTYRLRKLLGMVNKSEKLTDNEKNAVKDKGDYSNLGANQGLVDQAPETSSADSKKPDSESTNSSKGHGKRGADSFEDCEIHHHPLEGLKKGDPCPFCDMGKLYKYEPSVFVRIVGNTPFQAIKHICERLRCNSCNEYFTAELPEKAKKEGPANQRFGYSAIALMAVQKFLISTPYYRSQKLQNMLDLPISASTIFDQIEKFANAGAQIHRHLNQIAANYSTFFMDDTTGKILKKDAKRSKRTGKLKKSVYTSAIIAERKGEPTIILYETSVGHTGDMADQLFKERCSIAAKPIIMTDALSHNKVTAIHYHQALCNVHARRNFHELKDQEPQYINPILQGYAQIAANEKEVVKKALDDQHRLDFHKKNSLPILDKIRSEAAELIENGTFEENSNFGKAYSYLQNNWKGLTAFCQVAGAPIENNLAERVLKLIVNGRKNYYFYRTTESAAISDTATVLLVNAEYNGINPFEYAKAILQNSAACANEPEKWLPWNYHQNL